MQRTRDKRRIRDVVHRILIDDVKARNDDRYLYVRVIEEFTPEMINRPFQYVYMHPSTPSTETVRRSRQWVQAHFKDVRPNATTSAWRHIEEEDYKEVFK